MRMTRNTFFEHSYLLLCLILTLQQFDALGIPPAEDLTYVQSDDARRFVSSLPRKSPISWAARFPSASPLALELLSTMLQFNPEKRITVEAAMDHAYFDSVRRQYDDPPEPALSCGGDAFSFEYDPALDVKGEYRFFGFFDVIYLTC